MSAFKILLVDDEVELVTAMVERLEMRGIKTDGVTNGNDAIRLIEENRYDAVILDIKMPGLDGRDIMKHIKKMNPDIPVLLFTGHETVEEDEKGLLANSHCCLIKPVSIEVIIEQLNACIKGECKSKD